MRLEELENKKILILGFGREGTDSFLALRKLFPKKPLAIADKMESKELPKSTQKFLKLDKKVKLYFGKDYLKSLKNYDLIIRTPGIPLSIINPFLTHSTRASTELSRMSSGQEKQKVTSQTEIFFENYPGTIIGVTGTKGKGTVAALIYQILKKSGLKVRLAGNIGKPVFQTLLKAETKEIFVYELSSHQLQGLKKSPQIAVFLNLWPAHLDYFKNFKEYQKAKENITRYQTKKDFFIYNSNQKLLREIAKKSKAKKIPFGVKNVKELAKIISQKEIPLKGKSNFLNVLAAVKVGELFNVKVLKIREAVRSFKSLPHRLEFVGKYRGIAFYNDSLATVPQATVAALDGLGDKVKTLILGGSDSRVDFSVLIKRILKSNLRTLIFLSPGTGEQIWQKITALKKTKLPNTFFVSSMGEAVKKAFQSTGSGEICLLSPGAPSFNLFQDYQERGDLFKRLVKKHGCRAKKTS